MSKNNTNVPTRSDTQLKRKKTDAVHRINKSALAPNSGIVFTVRQSNFTKTSFVKKASSLHNKTVTRCNRHMQQEAFCQ